jgi:hypothetical protein
LGVLSHAASASAAARAEKASFFIDLTLRPADYIGVAVAVGDGVAVVSVAVPVSVAGGVVMVSVAAPVSVVITSVEAVSAMGSVIVVSVAASVAASSRGELSQAARAKTARTGNTIFFMRQTPLTGGNHRSTE